MKFLIILCITLCLFAILPVSAQSGILLELDIGAIASVTEFFHSPLVDAPKTDPYWNYDWDERGERYEQFPEQLHTITPEPQITFDHDHIDFIADSETNTAGTTNTVASQTTLPLVFFAIDVKADLMWQSSNVVLSPGQRYRIQVTGRWSMHEDERWCDARGILADGPLGGMSSQLQGHPNPICPLPLHPAGALAAKIGNNRPFYVGTGGEFTANNYGELQFMSNDVYDGAEHGQPCVYCGDPEGHLWNNSGSLKVVVIVD